jgi:hypothetical protein
MNFSTLKPQIKESSVQEQERQLHPPSNSLKGQPLKADFSMYQKVYQGCGECKTETEHYIYGTSITCMVCGNQYKLVNTR